MKPIVIDSKFVKRELWILLGCFVAAVIFDLVGIIMFKRPAIELLTTIGSKWSSPWPSTPSWR